MTLRQTLRARTDDLHQALDARLGRFDLGRRDDYRQFLLIHARILPAVEQALDDGGIAAILPDWAGHRRAPLLERDLAALSQAPPEPLDVPAILGTPDLLGTAYVIEGSRLGSRFLARRVGVAMPAEYLTAAGQRNAWPALVGALDDAGLTPSDTDRAVAAARDCFGLFLRAAEAAAIDG